MRVIKKFEMREFNYGYGVVTHNFLLNYSLFKIIVNPRKTVQFSSEKQKDMSDDGIENFCFFKKVLNFCDNFFEIFKKKIKFRGW